MKKMLVVTLLLISMMLLTIPVSAWNPQLNGDANHMGNGFVGMDDVAELNAHWWDGTISGPEGYCPDTDIWSAAGGPLDGYVDIYEVAYVNGNWLHSGAQVRNMDNIFWRRNYPYSQSEFNSWGAQFFWQGSEPDDWAWMDSYANWHYDQFYNDTNGYTFPAYDTGTFHYMECYGNTVGYSIFSQGTDVTEVNHGYPMTPILVGNELGETHTITVTFKTYSLDNGVRNLQAVTVWGQFMDDSWFQIVIIVYVVGLETPLYPTFPNYIRTYKDEGGYQWTQFVSKLGVYVPQNQWTTFEITMNDIYNAMQIALGNWSGYVTCLTAETQLKNAAADFWVKKLTYNS